MYSYTHTHTHTHTHAYICCIEPLDGCCSLCKFIRRHFILPFMIICYGYGIENRVGSRLAWGWTNQSFKVPCGRCCVRTEPGLHLTAIVWIARPCVAYSTELIMKCLNLLLVNPLPFMSLSFILWARVSLKKKVFVGVTNSSHNY